MNRNIINIARFFIFLYILLFLMNTYWSFFREKNLSTMKENPRLREDLGLRGGILAGSGEYLAKNINRDGEIIRLYPEGEKTAAITGYWDQVLGKSGLEYNCDELLKSRPFPFSLQGLKDRWEKGKGPGYNIRLTIDMTLTEIAYEALGEHSGAIVAMRPSTGEILVMVSKPSFDPNLIKDKWKTYREDLRAPLLDRCLQGLYPPGSIFKILVAAAALEEGIITEDTAFYCPGYIEVEGYQFHCSYPHGRQDINRAMANSCNVAFAETGLKLGKEKLIYYYDKFFKHNYRNIPLPVIHSELTEKNILTDTFLAQTSFGQGELMITPLEACLMTCCIANKGKIMSPCLIKEIRDSKNRLIEKTVEKELARPVSSATADRVKEMMEAVVEDGTGYRAQIEGIKVAGKTGTAENPHGNNHAWFTGFAPADNPEIAIAVIIEEGGSGGEMAAPVAREIIIQAMREQ